MKGKPYFYAGAVTLTLAAALGLSVSVTQADPKKTLKVPAIQVDASWPKLPLPVAGDFGSPCVVNGAPVSCISSSTGKLKPWATGEVAGTCVDSQDHVFTVNRAQLIAPSTVDSVSSPTVIEYDPAGNVVNAWNTTAPQAQIHGCFVDYQDNVWIAGNGDGVVQKWKHDGSAMLLQIGTLGVCDNPPANTCGNSGGNPLANMSHTLLNEPATVWVDPNPDPVTGQRGSVYIADGYGNHRVAVFNATGTYLRQWGYVAGVVNDPQTDSRGGFASGDGGHPHCVVGGNDGLIYTCDRADDRIQVFSKTGTLVRIINVVPGTGVTLGIGGAAGLGTAGSAWDLSFTRDPEQTYFFEADGGNEILHTMLRNGPDTNSIVANWGQPGHAAGQFTFLHTLVLDSKGNVYTGETINGRRIQKFTHVECNNGNGKGNGNGNC